MKIPLSIVLVLALACSPAAAQCPPGVANCPTQPWRPSGIAQAAPATRANPAVVRIRNSVGRIQSYGSGTLIAKNSHDASVVTCAHLFSDGVGQVVVGFPDGSTFAGRLREIDRVYDLALLTIAPPVAEPLTLSPIDPGPGVRVSVSGFGPDGRYQARSGSVRGYSRTGESPLAQTLIVAGMARDGDSGGPVLDEQGRLVAVIWGTDGSIVTATCCKRVRRFLQAILPPYGRRAPPARRPGLGAGGVPSVATPAVPPQPDPETPAQTSPALSLAIGTVKTLPAGSDATASLREAGPGQYVLDLGIPRGTDGARGAAGPRGPAGPAGAVGPAGQPGSPGPTRSVTVIFQDSSGKALAKPVVVPPDKSVVRVPINRVIVGSGK